MEIYHTEKQFEAAAKSKFLPGLETEKYFEVI